MRDDDAFDEDTLDDGVDLDARDRALLAADRFDELVDAVAIGVDASDSDRSGRDAALLSVARPGRRTSDFQLRPTSSTRSVRDRSPSVPERRMRNERRRVGGSPRSSTATRPSRLGRVWLIVGLLFAAFFGIRAIPSRSTAESTMGASLYAPTATPQPRYVTRNIEDLQPGDTVIAADPETGEVGPRLIVQKFERVAYKLCVLELTTDDGLTQTLEPTPEHPFYLPATNEWREAGELNPGDQVLDPAGALQTVVTNRIDDHPEGVPVYNMEVEGLHTYFVAAHGARAPPVLVHNTSGNSRGCGVGAQPTKGRPIVPATQGNRFAGGVPPNLRPTPTGQIHHPISRRVGRALSGHPSLRGHFQPRDRRFTTQAINGTAHRGYQRWHIDLDAEVVRWIRDPTNVRATPQQFLGWLRQRYNQPDLLALFPNGF
jgi:hypothetical protein